jgi:hypothetical protein
MYDREEKRDTTTLVHPRFGRAWRSLDTWEAWYDAWQTAEHVEGAVGLLYALPLRDWRAVNFLVELLNDYKKRGGQDGAGVLTLPGGRVEKNVSPAQRLVSVGFGILVFKFLKPPALGFNGCRNNGLDVWPQFYQRSRLFRAVLNVLLDQLSAIGHIHAKDVAKTVAGFLAYWVGPENREARQLLVENRILLYRLALEAGMEIPLCKVRGEERQHLAALHELALDYSMPRGTPSVGEALTRGGVAADAARFYLAHKAMLRHFQQE